MTGLIDIQVFVACALASGAIIWWQRQEMRDLRRRLASYDSDREKCLQQARLEAGVAGKFAGDALAALKEAVQIAGQVQKVERRIQQKVEEIADRKEEIKKEMEQWDKHQACLLQMTLRSCSEEYTKAKQEYAKAEMMLLQSEEEKSV